MGVGSVLPGSIFACGVTDSELVGAVDVFIRAVDSWVYDRLGLDVDAALLH